MLNSFRILTQNSKSIITQNGQYYLVYAEEPLPPTSAGTEYTVCVTCNGVATEVNPPHPVWTNNYGQEVTLLDAVVLGGLNGLNS